MRNMHRIIGLDIGGTKCAVLTADSGAEIELLKKIRFDTHTERGFEYARRRLFDAVRASIAASDRPVEAIGVSCGGPLNSRTGVIQSPPNLPGWDDVPLVRMLEEEFGVPAFLQNDANACALVEWRMGAGCGSENMVFLTMGTGMGAGIIAEGRLLRGRCDMAGEVGHVRLAADGPVGYGKAGSFEGFCSGGGIARLACRMRRGWAERGEHPAWSETDEEMSTRALAGYAKDGDAYARQVFEAAGEKLGCALALLADVLNPETIVIGSVYVRCEELLREAMWRALRREALAQTVEGLQVLPAQTGEQIGDLAAVMVAEYGLAKKRGL